MRVLGIESSCDETAAAVVTHEGVVLSDVVQTQIKLHATYGGVVPELASRDHLRNAPFVIEQALNDAGCTLAEVDAIAVTHRPGLTGALLVGVQIAKGMTFASGLPLIGVDHLMGHLFSAFLRRPNEAYVELRFPFVALLASGGHTAIYRVDGLHSNQIHELGATRDDAAGEAFDKGAKLMGLGYPGGPVLDKLAAAGDASLLKFGIPMPSSLEFSFSGLKTQLAMHLEKNGLPSGQRLADLAASYQRALVGSLASKVLKAAKEERVACIVIGGGVAANHELRTTLAAAGTKLDIDVVLPSLRNCTDNAAMIAYAGAARFMRGERDGYDLPVTSQTILPRRTRKGGGPRKSA